MKFTSVNTILFTAAVAFVSSGITVQADDRYKIGIYALNNCGKDLNDISFYIGEFPSNKDIVDDTCAFVGESDFYVTYEIGDTGKQHFDCLNDKSEFSIFKCGETLTEMNGQDNNVCVIKLCDEDADWPTFPPTMSSAPSSSPSSSPPADRKLLRGGPVLREGPERNV